MSKRGLPSKQLPPDSSLQRQESLDLFPQQQQSDSSPQQQPLRDLRLQQQQLRDLHLQQQPPTDLFLQQQPSDLPSSQFWQNDARGRHLRQDEARGLQSRQSLQQNIIPGSYIVNQQQGFHYQFQPHQTSNFQEQLQPDSYSQQQPLRDLRLQQQPPTDSSLQQQPSDLSFLQDEARGLPLWQLQQQNMIPGSYIGDQQQDFHYQLQPQQTSNFQEQQNLYMSYPYARGYYQYPSQNVERNQEWQPHYSHGVLNLDQQSVQEANYLWRSPRPRLQQSTYNQSRHQISHSLPQQQQVPQYSLQQHQVIQAQQLRPQISQDLLHQVPANPFLQQSTLRQQVPPVLLQQQQQYSFSQQHEIRDQQQRMRGQQQQGIQTQSHQYFEAEIDNANYDEQTQVVEQDNDRAKSNMEQQQQATKNIISALSQLTLKQTSQETKITQKISSIMKQYQACIPKRQGVKKAEGTHISVLTNMFKIKFNGNFTNAVHYDVDITSTVSSKFPKALYRKVFEKCRSEHFTNRYPAFDGRKNAYSAKDLPFGSHLETDIKIQDYKKQCNKQCDKQCDKHVKIFKIILHKVANIDLSWMKNLQPGLDEVDRDQTGIQVLDIIMRHGPESQYVNIGRSLFWDLGIKETLTNLTGGLSSARGGFLSAVLGWQMYLNVDVVHKGFITPQKVADLINELDSEMKRNTENKENNNKAIAKFLKGLKVIYEVPQQSDSRSRLKPRTYHLNGLGPNANEHKFPYKGSDITIRKYFENRYKYILRDPNLPCLSVGAQGNEIYLPAELCTVMAGQSVKKLNKIQTSKMITVAAESALKRRQRIKEAFNKINVNIDPTMRQEFRLSVNTEMEKVDARILKAPILKYADAEVPVNNGKWYMKKFMQPMKLKNDEWTIINLDKSHKFVAHHNMCVFMENLIRIAKFVGMEIERPNTKNFKSLDPEKTEEIRNYFENNKALKLIIVVISNSPDTIYNKIKQITELELGVLTQCIKYQNICEDNKSTTTIRNILLKINTKLNGINHILYTRPKCFNNVCMLVGADVTHPSHDENTPSIAAVTASCDMFGSQYNVVHKLLQPREEIILDLEEIIKFQLVIYREKTLCLPERIIYYRDGVSEGQFPQVIYYEIQAIKRACKAHKADIQITCLVVQKRHHVRFFPIDDQMLKSNRKPQNVEAGTIVDTDITHPDHIDFYLVSHESIKGTARPTKYRCIWKESNYTEDDIEELTYYLCHMYARCTKTVSYPAPTYYAHLAAYRAKVLIQGRNLVNLEMIQQEFNKKMINSPMYFV
ncbi:protein argonaute-2-like isoform X1 [Formica exsecta]|uniref:protein argonaute-2-like isoform X1 n=1 Tax=Formica exsecta TaxID=72781 RepID=UPI001143071C|nr:protein argonaute-2-like isoform X1 [Formica exsecta]